MDTSSLLFYPSWTFIFDDFHLLKFSSFLLTLEISMLLFSHFGLGILLPYIFLLWNSTNGVFIRPASFKAHKSRRRVETERPEKGI